MHRSGQTGDHRNPDDGIHDHQLLSDKSGSKWCRKFCDDGADAVMLSGETSVGQYPAKVVEYMRNIITTVEAKAYRYNRDHKPDITSDSFYLRFCLLQRMCDGIAGRSQSNCRNDTFRLHSLQSSLPASGGRHPHLHRCSGSPPCNQPCIGEYEDSSTTEEYLQMKPLMSCNKFWKDNGYVQNGDIIINLASIPLVEQRRTNMIKLSRVKWESEEWTNSLVNKFDLKSLIQKTFAKIKQHEYSSTEKEICETAGAPGFENRIREIVLGKSLLWPMKFTLTKWETSPRSKRKACKKSNGSGAHGWNRFHGNAHWRQWISSLSHPGRIWPKTLTAQRVIVHGKKDLIGVMGSKPIHIMSVEERNKPASISDFLLIWEWQKEVEKFVQIGDPITERTTVDRNGELCQLQIDRQQSFSFHPWSKLFANWKISHSLSTVCLLCRKK